MKQEDKAKAYDKVRKKIAIRFGSNVADEFFAEFEESEDEKIRKKLIEAVKGDMVVGGTKDKQRAIAWLEKQAEVKESTISQHEIRTCEENGNSLTYEDERIRKAIKVCLIYCNSINQIENDVFNDCIAWLENIPYTIDHEKREGFHLGYRACLEKRGEQKPADSYCQENCKGFQETGKCFADGGCKAKREAEQKPEENKGNIGGISANWSEEDERILDSVIGDILNADTLIGGKETASNKCSWLESLKGRVQPQPKQEWSDVDKDILFCIINDLKFLRDTISIDPKYAVSIIDMEREITWLKSLRPQSQWKPTDEQMGCLSDAIEHYNSLGYPAPKLKELLDDLKELKGEV